MLDVPFPHRVCQIILYKCITQEKESIYILIYFSLMKSTVLNINLASICWWLTLTPLYWDVPDPFSHWQPVKPCSHGHDTLRGQLKDWTGDIFLFPILWKYWILNSKIMIIFCDRSYVLNHPKLHSE